VAALASWKYLIDFAASNTTQRTIKTFGAVSRAAMVPAQGVSGLCDSKVALQFEPKRPANRGFLRGSPGLMARHLSSGD
jgi:hypothetical protein